MAKKVNLDGCFETRTLEKKMSLLNINDDLLSSPRFKGINVETVVKDIWNSLTNSEKRKLLSYLV